MIDPPMLDTPWQIISSALVFFLGLYYAATQRSFDVPRPLALLLYFWHTVFCLYYISYSFENSADSTGYFQRSLLLEQDFGLSTVGIDYFTAVFSQLFNMSYLGVFLVNNIFGYIGLLALAASLREVTSGKMLWARNLAVMIVFLPGASFWSAAIGKDSLTFMGASLAAWAFLRLERRYAVLIVTAMTFVLARPHMAALILTAALFAIMIVANIRTSNKIGLTVLMAPFALYAIFAGAAMVGIDGDASVQELNELVEYRQSVNVDGESSVNIADMNVVMRLLSFMFRPLFFDAGGLLGLVASFENFLFLGLSLMCVVRAWGYRSALSRTAFWFFAVYIFLSWMLLANTTANLGLALRQKWMFMPMLILFVMSFAPQAKRKFAAIGRPRPGV